MRRLRLALTASLLTVTAGATLAHAGEVDLPAFPSISPGGEEVVFSWRGDLWKAPATGGHAVRLTSHAAVDSRSAWSPDGSSIAFNSDRSGALNVHVMDADGGNVRQVTHEDDGLVLTQFTADGRLLLQSYREGDVYREPRPFAVPVAGGPIRRLHDAHGRSPRLSADGTRLAFVRGGSSWSRRHYRGPADRDVWLQDTASGAFTRVTDWEGNDGRPMWGGGSLHFVSDRDDRTVDLYRISEAGDAPERLTAFTDGGLLDYDVTPDGSKAVLLAWDRLYSLDLRAAGAEPVALRITASEDEGDRFRLQDVASSVTEAELSPDGKVMATVAYGRIYVRHMDDGHPTRRVTKGPDRAHSIAWSPDGLKLFFTSDRDGTESIYAATVSLTRTEIKTAYDDATKPPEDAKAEETPTEDADAPTKDDGKGSDVGGDGKDTDEKDTGEEDTGEEDTEEKKDPALDPQRWHDGVRFVITPLVQTPENDRQPRPSPDGKSLAFRRGRGDLMVHDIASGQDRLLRAGWDTSVGLRWSPDSHHLAFSQDDRNFNSDVFVVRADGSSPPVNLTRHPGNDFAPRWSADGKVLAFISSRKNREFDVYRVFLDRSLEGLSKLEREEYFKEAAKAAKKRKPLGEKDAKKKKNGKDKDKGEDKKGEPKKDDGAAIPAVPQLDLNDAYRRLVRVTQLEGNETNLEITPAGDRFIFTGKNGTDAGLFSIKWDGKELKKLGPTGSMQHVSLTGDKVVWVASGKAYTADPGKGGGKPVAIKDTLRIDLEELSSQKFREAMRILGEVFYHPTMKGLDWPALTERYHELARRARTAAEFNTVAGRMLGELNASHLGVRSSGYRAPTNQPNGRLGVDHEPTEGGFRVTRVVPYGPASKGAMKLAVDDVITAIELEPFAPADTLESRLRGRVGKETIVTVRRAAKEGEPLELRLLVTPISSGAERNLRYDDWQAENARRVHERSGGRIGYLHIRSMNQGSLDEFERDLFAAAEGRDGLLVDVRNNGGGHTADRVLASIMVRPHAYTVPRGADPDMTTGYPQDRLFIQRYALPMNMLCNEKSFSNAEIVSHAFKTLGRGTLVGEQTYGGVISTGGTRLVDGTFVRLPFRGWYLPDGTDMENNGALPDLVVAQTPEAESGEADEQLDAAVDDLLKRL